MTRARFRLRRMALGVGALLAAQAVVSLALLLPPVHRWLLSGLQRTIGRPVEVSRFGLTLWNGPRVEAFYVTVEDEPEFGSEFLLRADRLDAVADWRALLRGRVVLSRVWLQRPSLNFVRSASGRWNYQSWIAEHGNSQGISDPSPGPLSPLATLTVSEGRINFKRGPEKLSLALLNVTGDIAVGSDGRWILAIRAQPFRAGVTLQDAGMLRLDGAIPQDSISATASSPTDVSVQWINASVPDALRLILGRDFGVRGRLESSISFRRPTRVKEAAALRYGVPSGLIGSSPGVDSGSPWSFSGALRLAEVHRWDLPLASGLPALNLSVEGLASADRRRLEFSSILIEAPRSNLRGRAFVDRDALRQTSMHIVTANIRLEDLLAWYRAFHPGVNPAAAFEGDLGADVELEGWPPVVVRGALVTTGARLKLPADQGSLFLGRAIVEADHTGARLGEAALTFARGDPGIRLSANWSWSQGIPFAARAIGKTEHLAALSAAIASLGLSPTARPVECGGSASLRMGWSGFAQPWQVSAVGNIALENVAVSGGLLRSQLLFTKAQLDFLPGVRQLRIFTAKAFGASWSGTMQAPSLLGPWKFRLGADRVDPALMIRGLISQPPENSSFLSRILPPQAAATVVREEPRWPVWLRGEGTITADTLAVGRLEFSRVFGRLSIAERSITLESAEATLAAGRVRGSARGVFGAEPLYSVQADFDGVNLFTLSGLAVSSRQCCTGRASGRLELEASGWKRDELLTSLKGVGSGSVRNAELLSLDLPASFAREDAVPGRTRYLAASGDFSFANAHVWLDRISLDLPSGKLEGKGNADYSGRLDLRLTFVPSGRNPQSGSASRLQLNGTLVSPRLVPAPATSP